MFNEIVSRDWREPKTGYFGNFSSFLAQETHFWAGRHENSEKRFSTLVLEIFCKSEFCF
jgi:hypothetical protein